MTTRTLPAAASARPLAVVGDYVRLTKPRIISLLLVTTAGAMFVAASGVPDGCDPADDLPGRRPHGLLRGAADGAAQSLAEPVA